MSQPELLFRIRAEYREMPGLRLTLAQACRLWQLDPADCDLVLQTLVKEQFLTRTLAGAFVATATLGAPATPLVAWVKPIDATNYPSPDENL